VRTYRITDLLRRRTGTVAAIVAVLAFVAGAAAAYRFADRAPAAPILLRQAVETSGADAGGSDAPGSGGLLVLLRNDGSTPVEVVDAAFSRSTAAPPLYLAPAIVNPGQDVNVYLGVPQQCQTFVGVYEAADTVPPVQVYVHAHQIGGPMQAIPVQVTGEFAATMDFCRHHRAD
jgi:hypothetical protein